MVIKLRDPQNFEKFVFELIFKANNHPTNNQRANWGTRTCTKGQVDSPRSVYPFLGFTTSLGSVKDTLDCKWICAYAKEFPVSTEGLDVDKLRTSAQETIGLHEINANK